MHAATLNIPTECVSYPVKYSIVHYRSCCLRSRLHFVQQLQLHANTKTRNLMGLSRVIEIAKPQPSSYRIP